MPYRDLCFYYSDNDDSDTDAVVSLPHTADSQHSVLRILQELLPHLDQLEASGSEITVPQYHTFEI